MPESNQSWTTREWLSGNGDLGEWINPRKQCIQFSLGFMGSCCSCAKLRESREGCPRSDIGILFVDGGTGRHRETEGHTGVYSSPVYF